MKPLSDYEQALLNYIFEEYKRIYSNKTQQIFDEEVKSSIKDIKYRPYNWKEEKKPEPNFTIAGKNFWFYKYWGRGMERSSTKLNENWFNKALKIINKYDR